MADWHKRPYNADTDESALMYMLGVSYCRSRAGKRAGAARAGGSTRADGLSGPASDSEIGQQKAFLAVHRPIWQWLFENADVTLVHDPEQPVIIWGWLIASGDNVVHAVGCKRSFTERPKDGGEPLSVELVTDLLGDRLTRHQVLTLELPQMYRTGMATTGIDRPMTWSLDPTWLLTRMIGRLAA